MQGGKKKVGINIYMCGISGYFLKKKDRYAAGRIDKLLGDIRHRGPDDEGVCLISRDNGDFRSYRTDNTVKDIPAGTGHIRDAERIIPHDTALIHTRYSIIDLSSGGHQPFVSRDGAAVAVFNGEIYNYIELREELISLGIDFRTRSDTEVLVEGFRVWGQGLWAKMNGFWAVVIYDRVNNTIVMSRDRIGVAPLYYTETEEGIFFSSVIKPLIHISSPQSTLNEDIVRGFIQTGIKDHNYSTYYDNIHTVPSAAAVIFEHGCFEMDNADTYNFWHFPRKRLSEKDLSFESAVEKYRHIFFDAVKLRLRSDVKLAFELSGGLDSSSVVAAAAMMSGDKKITTYTAKVKGADEEPFARSILKMYDIDYHVLSEIEDNFTSEYGAFSDVMEEPYDNPNDYTHYEMLRTMKSEGIHVVVTGAGGDEVLAGYQTSFWPKAYEEMKKDGIRSFLRADWYEFCKRFKTINSSVRTLKHYMLDPFVMLKRPFLPPAEIPLRTTSALRWKNEYKNLTFQERALYHFKVALIPYYMRSSDHFTMNIPLEHRFPFLDYTMVEFGLTLPVSYLFRNGWTKYILRKAMEPYLPGKIVWRRQKMGFSFPYSRYFDTYKDTFTPLMKELETMNIGVPDHAGYDRLLKSDPAGLWRILSTAIWIKHTFKATGDI